MLQEFALYLELRLKCINMAMLRRIFADFLNEQENTLVPMMHMGFSIVTIYPVLRTSPKRLEKAKILLQKPKFHLDTRGCVFLYLQYRTATRNMVLFKQLFLEFVEQRETSLMIFVQRGFEVISVIPFELSQLPAPINAGPQQVQQDQLELTRRVQAFEEQIPWEVAYSNLPAPFDESKHAELSTMFRNFWRKHARAVWERNFWSVMTRKLNPKDFHERNSRQNSAKNAFEALIVAAYSKFGAQFFVKLDEERHPGWWYRGIVVSLFSLQQIKGERAMWKYVKEEALKRFPDCELQLPLAASNSGAMRARHARESRSMWMSNHELTETILKEIATLKEKQRMHHEQQTPS
eukprot:jgi/Phyca11/106106/e_gw1.11.481.1